MRRGDCNFLFEEKKKREEGLLRKGRKYMASWNSRLCR